MAQAQMRFTLSEELTGLLDDLRGPATRTGYALWLLERGLRQEAAEAAGTATAARKAATRPSGSAPSAAELARERAREQRDDDDPRSVIRNLPSMR